MNKNDAFNDSGSSPPTTDDTMWDASDVARYFKASRSWVYQQAEAGILPCVRLGGLLRFDPRAVRDVIPKSEPGSSKRVVAFKPKGRG